MGIWLSAGGTATIFVEACFGCASLRDSRVQAYCPCFPTALRMALLEIQQLQKSFRQPTGGPRRVINVDRFKLEEAEVLAIQGESGAGKSTFLNLVAGILTPDSGRVMVGGTEITGLREPDRDRWRARNLGYVFQSFNLLPGYSCLENILLAMSFGVGANRATARRLLQEVGLEAFLHHKPRQLSAGQQQRVAVARALANEPKLVLADEPTGNLDHRNTGEIVALIRESCRRAGAALLLVSHDRDVLATFPSVIQLSDINKAAVDTEAVL